MVVIGFILGTILGSLSLALAERSLAKKSFWGRSYCLHCKKSLQWYDLFPVLSYLVLKGKCRYCGKSIGLKYLVVEIAMGLLVGFLFWQSFQNFSAIGGSAFGWQFLIFIWDLIFKIFFITILLILTITDLKKNLIPDRIIIPSLKIAFFSLAGLTLLKIGYLYFYLKDNPVGKYLLPPHSDYFQRHALITAEPFWGAVISAAALALFFYSLLVITKGKGMGGGDIKLGAFLGLGLGFPLAVLATILAFFTGALAALILMATGKKHFGQTLAFGPFLVFGSLVALFWGNLIMGWYFDLGT